MDLIFSGLTLKLQPVKRYSNGNMTVGQEITVDG